MTALVPQYVWVDGQGPAFGAPGMEPRWTSAAKDAVGTAYAASSRAWYTISHGILNEIYYPTIDRPQIRDMEFLITDGETFFHESKRDLKHEFAYIDSDALGVRITARDCDGRYTLTKEIINDPHYPVVLMRVRLDGDDKEFLSRLQLYALLSPHVDGGGRGNSARTLLVAGQLAAVAWKNQTSLALATNAGFVRASCGYVGTSDGWQDLKHNLKMDWEFGSALNGNVAVMGQINPQNHNDFTVAIGFGEGHHAALSATMGALVTPFDKHLKRFIEQWHRAASPREWAENSRDGGRLLQVSHNVVLAHEDKTYAGAFIASASIPWGYAKSDDDLGGYHLVWTRDMVQSATALLACGRVDTARRALTYLACTQRPDGGFAQNFWIDGTPYWTGIQLDEVAFPIMLAWRLWKMDGLGEFDIFPFVERAAAFLVRYAPVTQQERWEEIAGYSPSTLAAVISALVCAADIARSRQASELGAYLESYADWIEAHLDEWTTTTEGVLHPDVKYHYMRIRPPAEGEPFYNSQLPPGYIHINNREPGEKCDFEARAVVDAGFLELVRYGIRRADDPLIVDSLKVVDHCLKIETPFGDCWRRYNHDGYGQKKDGGPYDGSGQGRAWPILTGERGHYELCTGSDFSKYIMAIEQFSSVGGMLPEQVWDHDDIPSRGMYRGRSAGSAQPLVWAHSEYLKLLRSAADWRVFDRIQVVADRYAVPKGKRTFTNHIEIFEPNRPISSILSGHTLRIVNREPFRAVYTYDNWATTLRLESRSVGYSGSFVDIPTGVDQIGKITFTLAWPVEGQQDRWLGRNIDVAINEVPASTKV